jgi:uncharacterized membrane protein
MRYTWWITVILLSAVTVAACTMWPTWEQSLFTGSVTAEIQGIGTEPFWGFQFSGTDLIWSEPGETEVTQTTYHEFNQTLSGDVILYTSESEEIAITASFLSCSDGMSDNTYPLTIAVQKDGQTFSGCGMM